jgi:hypothetical protein
MVVNFPSAFVQYRWFSAPIYTFPVSPAAVVMTKNPDRCGNAMFRALVSEESRFRKVLLPVVFPWNLR